MRYLLILSIVLFYSCKNNTKTATFSTENETVIIEETVSNEFDNLLKSLPIYSEDFFEAKLNTYIAEDDEGYYVNKKLIGKNLDAQTVLTETKTEHDYDNWLYKVSKKEYFPLYKVSKGDVILIGSFVEYAGENDIPGVFFQLHSFDMKGNQKDYLIVFNRFSFELVLKSGFQSNNNFSEITVNSVEEDWLNFDENGEMIGERETPLIARSSKLYILTENGLFSEK